MSLVVKLFIWLSLGLMSGMAGARNLHILVIGEGSAANCNEHQFATLPYVAQIGLDGSEKPAADPFEWSDCEGGSIWLPLGELRGRRHGVEVEPRDVLDAQAVARGDGLARGLPGVAGGSVGGREGDRRRAQAGLRAGRGPQWAAASASFLWASMTLSAIWPGTSS